MPGTMSSMAWAVRAGWWRPSAAAAEFPALIRFQRGVLRAVRAAFGVDPNDSHPFRPNSRPSTPAALHSRAPGAPDVRVLVYTPPRTAAATGRPAYLHMHGGGS